MNIEQLSAKVMQTTGSTECTALSSRLFCVAFCFIEYA